MGEYKRQKLWECLNMNYYKSFDDKLQGKNNYQFEVNGIYQIDHSDTWEWFHLAQYVSSTLIYQGRGKKIRICIVEPLGETAKFKAIYDGYNKGYYFTTNKIKICRELSDEEILKKLIDEKCDFRMILEYTKPPFNYFFYNKKKIRGNYICSTIAKRNDFSLEEKHELLPVSQLQKVLDK
jgi:hypothetical protein